jgi:single-strand DNA-binding protein
MDKSGQKQERTEWHRVVVWGKLAELCNQYLVKGRQVYVEGRLQTRQWQDKDNQTKYTTEVNAQTIQFLGGNAGAERGAGAQAGAPMNHAGGMDAGMGFDSGFGGGRQASGPMGGPPAGTSFGGMNSEPSFTEDDIPF